MATLTLAREVGVISGLRNIGQESYLLPSVIKLTLARKKKKPVINDQSDIGQKIVSVHLDWSEALLLSVIKLTLARNVTVISDQTDVDQNHYCYQ